MPTLLKLLLALLLLAITVTAPAHVEAQRTVFAHFMLANQNDVAADAPVEDLIASYQRQIQQAQALGIDGFALNAGGWFTEPRYIRRTAAMFEAAYRLHTTFRLMVSADMCCSNGLEDVEDMVRRFAGNPRYQALYYRQNGRYLLTTFAGTAKGPAFWQKVRHDLETGTNPSTRTAPETLPAALASAAGIPASAPLPLTLIPAFFWGGELPTQPDLEAGLAPYKDTIDGAFYWGIAGAPNQASSSEAGQTPDQIPSATAYGQVLHAAGKLYMAPICLQFWGANAARYYEYSGFAGLRALWRNAILTSHPELVEIITWNDFVEGSYVSPIADPAAYPHANDLDASPAPVETLHYFHSHRGADALLAYYIHWYKTGQPPAITHDLVAWAYRTVLNPQPAGLPAIKLYGPVKNTLYVTANLQAAATLEVREGTHIHRVEVAAGSHDLELPLEPGPPPVFTLLRRHHPVAQGQADDPIVATAPLRNLYDTTGSMHN